MAHIQKRGQGKWRARYRGPDGREHSKTFKRRMEAERFLAAVESRKNVGEWIDPQLGRTTFGTWLEQWSGTIVHLKPKTLAGYETIIRCYIEPVFADIPLARIEPVDVKRWVAALVDHGLSPSRVRQTYQLFAAIMRSAVESEYIGRSPCIGVRLPRITMREMRFLDATQIEALAASAAERAVMIYTLAYGGLR